MLGGFPERPKTANARKPRSIMLAAEPVALSTLRKDDPQVALADVTEFVHWPGQAGYQPPPPPRPLDPQEEARFEKGKQVYAATCIQCHKITGQGQDNLAPPLLDSEWALGPEARLIRIVLHGLNGPITVNGGTHILDMPSLGALSDDEIASVLTYVRRSWDHEASPVDPKVVSAIRASESTRSIPWTERELLKVK